MNETREYRIKQRFVVEVEYVTVGLSRYEARAIATEEGITPEKLDSITLEQQEWIKVEEV